MDSKEHANDIHLVHLVQLHRIADKATQSLPFDETVFIGAHRPIAMAVRALQRELDELRQTWVNDPAWQKSLQMHCCIVETYIHEVGLQLPARASIQYSGSSLPAEPLIGISDSDSLLRVEILYGGLVALKGFFDHLFSMNAVAWRNHTYVTWAHLIHALAVLSKLSLLQDSDYDLEQARRVLDFAEVLDQLKTLSEHLHQTRAAHTKGSTQRSMLTRMASQVVQLKTRYQDKLAGRGSMAPRNDPVGWIDSGEQGGLLDGLDDGFWQDIIDDWNSAPAT